ncbi:hypothetical protein B0I37DRAFT_446280 [Chaetomium sp. MPI-CAGE-AT-0009]|nr:hypothetical protein B0I37DRAFT_446280 [Chaetomium sp. MPI-CAGE-AT-0009]
MLSSELDRPLRRSCRRAGRCGHESHENGDLNHQDDTTNAPTSPIQDKAGADTAPARLYEPRSTLRSSSASHSASKETEQLGVGQEKRVGGAWGHRHALLAFLALATTATAICAWFCLGPYGQGAMQGSWDGDPRVNIPISSLHPEDVEIVAIPFPIADVVTMAEVYTNASFDIRLPRRTSNITLRLDAPGLVRVSVASFLPQVRAVVGYDAKYRKEITGTKVIKAENEPFVVDMANTTLTLDLLEKLWPVLVHATTDLLVFGLGRDHNDYGAFRDALRSLANPEKPSLIAHRPGPSLVLIALASARDLWGELYYSRAVAWPDTALEWLHSFWWRITNSESYGPSQRPGKGGGGSGSSAPTLGSSRLPSSTQLLRHARRQLPAHETLPGLLAGLPVSWNATVQAYQTKAFFARVHPYRKDKAGLHSGLKTDHTLLCFSQDLLEAVADGRCPEHASEESVVQNHLHHLPYWARSTKTVCDDSGGCLHGLHGAICDAETFLSAFAAKAKEVKARVKEVVEARGGFSPSERVAGHYNRDGIVKRTRTLDRALDTLDSLLSSLAIQHRILAGMATRMLHVCALQESLQERASSLDESQSAWWDLAWDADRDTVVLRMATFPEIEDTADMLRKASARMRAEHESIRPRTIEAIEQLKAKVSAGWLKRLGLDDLPGGTTIR